MQIGQFGMPGTAAARMTTQRNIFWGGDESRINIVRYDAQFASTAADAGNTPTTVLRTGLLMAENTDDELVPWNPDAVDGTENIYGVNSQELVMVDDQGSAVKRFAPVVVQAPLKASQLLIEGSAMVGHEAEYLARRILALKGCLLEDDVTNHKSGITPRQAVKATNYTVVADDNGTLFIAITADANFTLPAIKPGLEFEFLRASDHELVITSAAGDDMVVGNDLSADSFTFTTAGQQIGARVRVKGIYLNGTKKWLVEVGVAPYSTGALMASAIAT